MSVVFVEFSVCVFRLTLCYTCMCETYPWCCPETSNSGSISSSYSIEWRLSDQFIVYFCHLLDWSVK